MASREELGRLDLMPKSDIDKLGQLLTNAEALISLLDGSGGGGVFLVTATNSDGTYSTDKTSTEIYEAFENGMLPILIDASGFVFHLTKAVESGSYPQVRFEQTYVEDGDGVTTEAYDIHGGSEGDTVTHEIATFVGSFGQS